MALDFGTDDITEFLYVLLRRINFPYKEAELNRSYDWNLMEDLKSKVNTLDEVSSGRKRDPVADLAADERLVGRRRPQHVRFLRTRTWKRHGEIPC
jgi:hypothetical protein